jgi:hypothetical protein
MNKRFITVGLLVAAGLAPAYGHYVPYGFGYGQDFGARVTLANAPGGAYVQCDPRSKSSPVRCSPDGW